jgi:chromosome partitioning protein
MRTIALANQKGGTGKTTTAVNLSAALAERRRRVLLLDLDPQSHLTVHFGVTPDGQKIYGFLMGETQLAEVVRQNVVPGIDLVPGGLELAGAEVELAQEVGRELMLRRALSSVPSGYHYVLLDCSPSLGLITVNALAAVREVFIPVQVEWLALRALGQLIETVQVVRDRLNPALEITGVIACMYKARRVLCAQVLETLRAHFGRRVFQTVIRESIRLAEAPSHGVPITVYDPHSRGAEDYRRLADEVIGQESEMGGSKRGRDMRNKNPRAGGRQR